MQSAARLLFVASLSLAAAPLASAQATEPASESLRGEDALFSVDSPIGAIEYRVGRGLNLGRTGLNLGGFTTLEFEREDGKSGDLAVDSVNFLALLEPIAFFRGFAELEVGEIFGWSTDEDEVHSDPELTAERLFGDLIWSDALIARFGKYQTPVGRWNLVPAEPFVWTPQEPVMLETAFDEHQTGHALLGTFFPEAGSVRYWIYGQAIDPLDKGHSPPPADRSAGGRLEFDHAVGRWSVGASYLASERKGDWSHLGGLDAQWQTGPLELTSEFVYQRGDIPDRDLWDVYLQAVYEVMPRWHVYGVARYEHYDPSGSSADADLADLGVAWIPRPWLHFKASYRVVGDQTEDVRRGLKVAFSVIF